MGWHILKEVCRDWIAHLTFDPGQTTAAGLRLAEALAVASTVFSRRTQLMQLTLLIFIDFLYACSFKEGVSSLGGIGMQEGAVIQVYSAEVDFILWDVINSQPVSLFGLLGAIFCKLHTEKGYLHDYDFKTSCLSTLRKFNSKIPSA